MHEAGGRVVAIEIPTLRACRSSVSLMQPRAAADCEAVSAAAGPNDGIADGAGGAVLDGRGVQDHEALSVGDVEEETESRRVSAVPLLLREGLVLIIALLETLVTEGGDKDTSGGMRLSVNATTLVVATEDAGPVAVPFGL